MTPEIALDLLLILLLCATVGYCVVLNARLGRLRDGQAEFKDLVDTLTAATDKAQASLRDLRELTETAAETLSTNIRSARELADELSLITESGNAVAQRFEARAAGGTPTIGSADLAANRKSDAETKNQMADAPGESRSETEKELLSMLRNVR
jgi:Domain of unknown function (DUF6468)